MFQWLKDLYALTLKMSEQASKAPGQYEWAQAYFRGELETIEILFERMLGDYSTPWPCQQARARIERRIVDKIATMDKQPHWPVLRRIREC